MRKNQKTLLQLLAVWSLCLLCLFAVGCACAEGGQGLIISANTVLAFDGSVTEVSIPEGVQSIAPYAFAGHADLTSISLPSTLQSISACAFYGTGLQQVNLPDGVVSVDDSAFYHCPALRKVVFSKGLQSIHAEAFAYCESLEELTLPEGLLSIGDRAFAACSSLKKITLPDSLNQLGRDVFPREDHLVVLTEENDYARKYCDQHGVYCRSEAERAYEQAEAEGRLVYLMDEAQSYEVWINYATASTQIKETSRRSYGPYNSIDIDNTTSWQFKTNMVGSLRNAYLDFHLRDLCAINGLSIKQGDWLNDNYYSNSRPTRVELSFCYKGSTSFEDPVEIEIPDDRSQGPFAATFDWRFDVEVVRMRILEIAKGSHYPQDVAVSEIRLYGSEMNRLPLGIAPET